MKDFSIIVAMDLKNGIAKDGQLPWYLPEDIENFVRITTQGPDPAKKNAIIMDQATWNHLDVQPLPGRINALVSEKELDDLPDDVLQFNSLDDALAAFSTSNLIDRVFVIGGESLYQPAVVHPNLKRIYITKIEGDFDCDQFFPDHIPAEFEVLSATDILEDNGIEYEFVVIGT